MVAKTAPHAAFTERVREVPHRGRAKQILATHPEVRKFFRRDKRSALWTVLLVAMQLGIAIGLASVHPP